RWVSAIWNLGFNMKLGSNWHRYAIRQNFPKLLEFPEEGGRVEDRMLPTAPPLYWAPFMPRSPYFTYDRSGEWYQVASIPDVILDQAELIGEIIDRRTLVSILEEHRSSGARTRTISFLLAILFWKGHVGSGAGSDRCA